MADKQIPKGFEYHVPDDYSITPTDRCMMALHSLGEVFDVFENYQSPIELMLGEFRMEQENDILKAVQECGVSVDKDELVKALRYDRGQYEKGYMNGYTKAKIETAREFAERLKEQKERICAGHGMTAYVVYVNDIDDLLKEMAGDSE